MGAERHQKEGPERDTLKVRMHTLKWRGGDRPRPPRVVTERSEKARRRHSSHSMRVSTFGTSENLTSHPAKGVLWFLVKDLWSAGRTWTAHTITMWSTGTTSCWSGLPDQCQDWSALKKWRLTKGKVPLGPSGNAAAQPRYCRQRQ
jgi:hypothetical protein